MPLKARKPTGSGPKTRLETIADFTGGLNLSTDTFQLMPNESPDLMNVVLDSRGGFETRRGVRPLSTAEMDPQAMWPFGDRLMVWNGTAVYWTEANLGGTYEKVNGTIKNATDIQAAVLKDTCYMVLGHHAAPRKWDGQTTNHQQLGPQWRDDYGSATGSNMPRAKYAATYSDYLWIANTSEDDQAHTSRVRFSHPNMPEAWRSFDWIDVRVGQDRDEITGLAAHTDHLLVFKNNSIHGIYGYDPDTFAVVTIADEVGAPGPNAIVETPLGVIFHDDKTGVYLYDGRQVQWLFEPLYPAIERGEIQMNLGPKDVHLGWVDQRLWVTVPWKTDVILSDWTMQGFDDSLWVPVNKYATQAVGGGPWNRAAERAGVDRLPKNFPDPTAWWCGPTGGNTENAPVGHWYMRWLVNVPKSGTYDLHYGMDNSGELYVDGVLRNRIGGYVNTTKIRLTLEAGVHIIAVHGFNEARDSNKNVSNPTACVWALYPIGKTDANDLIAHSDDNGVSLSYQQPAEPQMGTDIERRTFVWDPYVGQGAWVQFDLETTLYTTAMGGRTFASQLGSKRIQELDVHGQVADRFGTEIPDILPSALTLPGEDVLPGKLYEHRIPAWYRTRWIDVGQPGQRKRWRRSEAVLKGGYVSEMAVSVYVDWDATKPKRSFWHRTRLPQGVDEVGDDLMNKYAVHDKGRAFGMARAVSMMVEGPEEPIPWGVDALILKYKPKKVR